MTPLVWWWGAAAVVGGLGAALLRGVDGAFGVSVAGTGSLPVAIAFGALFGLVAGAPVAIVNAGLAQLGGRHWVRFLSIALPVAHAIWMLRAALSRTTSTLARAAMITGVVLIAWAVASLVVRITLGRAPSAAAPEEARAQFRPAEMSTSDAHGEDVAAFVRTSLRTHGSGNALFTLAPERLGAPVATRVLVDAGGTGHALDLEHSDARLAAGVEALGGFVVTDDRSLALAPPGLSAAAVISESISLIQKVTDTETVKVRFEGFGH